MQRLVGRNLRVFRRGMSTSSFADNDAVVVSIARTPVGKMGGGLSSLSAPQLGAHAIRGAVERAAAASANNSFSGDCIDEVVMGNVVSAGAGQAPGRQAVVYGGLPITTPTTDINKVCASGMKTVMYAAMSVSSGYRKCMIAGGMESMSNIPYYMPKNSRSPGFKLGHQTISDGLISDGLWDVYNNQHMGTCGDLCGKNLDISREDQDEYAVNSYKRAAAAWSKEGVMQREVVPVTLPQGRNKSVPPATVDADEEFTAIKLDKVPSLKPAFGKEGSVTAANASKLSDGAAAMVVCSGREARERGLSPLFRILGYSDACRDPVEFTIAPADAVPLAVEHVNRTTFKDAATPFTMQDIQFHEINEAFSVVALANAKIMGLDLAKVNLHGGAVSLGHPLGASGCRIIGALYNVLTEQKAKYGCASICNGGGGASAIIIEKLD